MYLWDDGTIGHLFRHSKFVPPPSLAGIIRGATLITTSPSLLHLFGVNTRPFLCEKEEMHKGNTAEYGLSQNLQVLRPDLDNSSVGFPHAVCSAHHYTHEFLVCDKQSNCRQHHLLGQSRETDDVLMTLCKSTLATLFTCRSDVEHVPYSLVCDHSQDCLDSSDEDFCVHPSCFDSSLFECTNKQVKSQNIQIC